MNDSIIQIKATNADSKKDNFGTGFVIDKNQHETLYSDLPS